MLFGRGTDEVMHALKRIWHWDDRHQLRGWREIGTRPTGSVCVPPIESEWGAGVAVVMLSRSLLACSAVQRGQNHMAAASGDSRGFVVPEEWMSYFSQDLMTAACGQGPVTGTETLEVAANRRFLDGAQNTMTGRVRYSSPCFAIGGRNTAIHQTSCLCLTSLLCMLTSLFSSPSRTIWAHF